MSPFICESDLFTFIGVTGTLGFFCHLVFCLWYFLLSSSFTFSSTHSDLTSILTTSLKFSYPGKQQPPCYKIQCHLLCYLPEFSAAFLTVHTLFIMKHFLLSSFISRFLPSLLCWLLLLCQLPDVEMPKSSFLNYFTLFTYILSLDTFNQFLDNSTSIFSLSKLQIHISQCLFDLSTLNLTCTKQDSIFSTKCVPNLVLLISVSGTITPSIFRSKNLVVILPPFLPFTK